MAQTVWITGASHGIGKEAALLFGKNGYQVAVGYQNSQEEAVEIASLLPNSKAYQADVSDPNQVAQTLHQIESQLGTVDLLIHSAGISQQKLMTDITQQDWETMIGVHLSGAFYCSQQVIPAMVRQKRGKIILLSSIWGITGGSCEVHYSAAKAGIIGLAKALAKELGPSGIQVNCVAPGVVDTKMNACFSSAELENLKKEIPLERFGSPQEIASLFYFLASNQANYITGQVISPNGGIVI